MAEFEKRNEPNELEEFVPKETEITPDFLPSEIHIKELRERLQNETPEGWSLFHDRVPYRLRTKRVTFSQLELAIPFAHYVLGDMDFLPIDTSSKIETTVSKAGVIGSALHELVPLVGFLACQKFDQENILNAFPTYKEESVHPYVRSLANIQGKFVNDIWEGLQNDEGIASIVEGEKRWFIEEYGDVPFSSDINEELKIRKSNELYEAGCKLIPHYLSDNYIPGITSFHEVMGIFNVRGWAKMGCRLQIPLCFDRIIVLPQEDGTFNFEIRDLKSGKLDLNYVQKVQALIMHRLARSFTNSEYMIDGLCKRQGSAFVVDACGKPPRNLNYSVSYDHFNRRTGKMTKIPVKVNYYNDQGYNFQKLLELYNYIFAAFRDKLMIYLKLRSELPALTDEDFLVQKEFEFKEESAETLRKSVFPLPNFELV